MEGSGLFSMWWNINISSIFTFQIWTFLLLCVFTCRMFTWHKASPTNAWASLAVIALEKPRPWRREEVSQRQRFTDGGEDFKKEVSWSSPWRWWCWSRWWRSWRACWSWGWRGSRRSSAPPSRCPGAGTSSGTECPARCWPPESRTAGRCRSYSASPGQTETETKTKSNIIDVILGFFIWDITFFPQCFAFLSFLLFYFCSLEVAQKKREKHISRLVLSDQQFKKASDVFYLRSGKRKKKKLLFHLLVVVVVSTRLDFVPTLIFVTSSSFCRPPVAKNRNFTPFQI